MAFIFLLMILRDMTIMVMIGSGSIAFGAVYLYFKNEAKKRESLGRNFLDSQTILGDMEIAEQIGIEGYEYIVLPEATIDGNAIRYQKMDLDEVSQALATPFIRFGGESTLRPTVIDRLVELRLMELKEEAERRARERIESQKEEFVDTEVVLPSKKQGRFDGIIKRLSRGRKRIRVIGDAPVDEEPDAGALFAPVERVGDDE